MRKNESAKVFACIATDIPARKTQTASLHAHQFDAPQYTIERYVIANLQSPGAVEVCSKNLTQ